MKSSMTFISVWSIPVVCVNTKGKTQMFVYNCQHNSSESLLYYAKRATCLALYLGHLQAYIRGGVHYTDTIPIRDLVLQNYGGVYSLQ
jgi:hypothetical protein